MATKGECTICHVSYVVTRNKLRAVSVQFSRVMLLQQRTTSPSPPRRTSLCACGLQVRTSFFFPALFDAREFLLSLQVMQYPPAGVGDAVSIEAVE